MNTSRPSSKEVRILRWFATPRLPLGRPLRKRELALASALIGLLALGLLALPSRSLSSILAAKRQQPPAGGEHPYHADPPKEELPPVIPPEKFGPPVVRNAYRLAAGLRAVLYQEPCYCHCGRRLGHTSLLNCYTTEHTAGCTICLKELFYIHEQVGKGRLPVEIRADLMMRSDWRNIDLQKYKTIPEIK